MARPGHQDHRDLPPRRLQRRARPRDGGTAREEAGAARGGRQQARRGRHHRRRAGGVLTGRRLHADAVEHHADRARPIHARQAALRPRHGLHPCRLPRGGAAGDHGEQGLRPQDLRDFEALARKEGRIDFGSGGPGSIGHVHGELLKKITGINMVHVPYRGGAPMSTDLIANTIPVGIDVITSYVPFFKSGQLVPLAVTGTQRSPLMPEVPTMVELRQPKLVLENFFGLSGPAKLPPDVVTRLNAACNEVLALPDIQKKLTELGIVAKPESVAVFNGFVKEQPRGRPGGPQSPSEADADGLPLLQHRLLCESLAVGAHDGCDGRVVLLAAGVQQHHQLGALAHGLAGHAAPLARRVDHREPLGKGRRHTALSRKAVHSASEDLATRGNGTAEVQRVALEGLEAACAGVRANRRGRQAPAPGERDRRRGGRQRGTAEERMVAVVVVMQHRARKAVLGNGFLQHRLGSVRVLPVERQRAQVPVPPGAGKDALHQRIRKTPADDPRGHAAHHGERLHIVRHHGARADHRAVADGDAALEAHARADPHVVADGHRRVRSELPDGLVPVGLRKIRRVGQHVRGEPVGRMVGQGLHAVADRAIAPHANVDEQHAGRDARIGADGAAGMQLRRMPDAHRRLERNGVGSRQPSERKSP
ncbi:tripartite tricarboxylate transporter family receptor domain-containing protein [Ditylenchus destructor]|uniref:Tripartite tricarboxylate transporter family receptor domain-containing protein n=1 Tax=Ditylenchus destructor TaxID=166010 RepID=A0AAD4MHX7_9BILA|nr:tripartite tricarboxylate transporter family receptor domain-containing protein [Ditylenchus destructor]